MTNNISGSYFKKLIHRYASKKDLIKLDGLNIDWEEAEEFYFILDQGICEDAPYGTIAFEELDRSFVEYFIKEFYKGHYLKKEVSLSD